MVGQETTGANNEIRAAIVSLLAGICILAPNSFIYTYQGFPAHVFVRLGRGTWQARSTIR